MEDFVAVRALGALAQEHRLAIFRTLLQEGSGGLSAGVIAERSGLSASNLSFHIRQLENAGLVRSERRQRSIVYSVEVTAVRDLLDFLMQDCCGGNPEICGVLPTAVEASDLPNAPKLEAVEAG